MRGINVRRKTRALFDPMGKPEGPVPWYKLDPEEVLDPWDESEEAQFPGIPFGLGPASRSGAPAYNPMSVEAPGIDTSGTSLLAEKLNWKI